MSIQTIGSIFVVLTYIPFQLYMILFAVRTPNWYKSEMGIHLMLFNFALVLTFGLSVIRIFAGASLDVPWFQWTRLVAFVLMPIVGFKQLHLLIKAQNEERKIFEGKLANAIRREENKKD